MNQKTIVMCVISLILGILFFYILQSVCGCKNVVEGLKTCVERVPGNSPTPPCAVAGAAFDQVACDSKSDDCRTLTSCEKTEYQSSPPTTADGSDLAGSGDWTDSVCTGLTLCSGDTPVVDTPATLTTDQSCKAATAANSCLRPEPDTFNPPLAPWDESACVPGLTAGLMDPSTVCSNVTAATDPNGYTCKPYTCTDPPAPKSEGAGGGCTKRDCLKTQVPYSDKSEPNSIKGKYGAQKDVQCDLGYQGGGPWFCAAPGTAGGDMVWSTDAAGATVASQCTAKACAARSIQNSDKTINQITGNTGEKGTVTCDPGYKGGGTWFCAPGSGQGDDSAWKTALTGGEDASTCTAKDCPTGSTVEHSTNFSSAGVTGKTGSTVNVACNEGYGPGGDWVCTADGKKTPKWATAGGATPPECSPSNCADLTPPNSNTQLTGHTGDEADVACTDGTVLQWKCGIDGTFNGNACPEPKGCCNPV